MKLSCDLGSDLTKRTVRPLFPVTTAELQEEVKWPLERGALRLLWLLLLLCPFWWAIDSLEPSESGWRGDESRARWDQRRAYWVIGWLILLVAMWLINPAPSAWKWFFAALALIRLLEIFTTGLGTILRQEQQVRARNLITIVLYAVQLTFIFAILMHSFAAADFGPDVSGGPSASQPFDYLYISWSSIATLGSTYQPETDLARILEVLAATSSLFLFGVLIAFGIGVVENEGS